MAIHGDAVGMMEKTLSPEAVLRARQKTAEIVANVRLSELRETFKIKQEEIVGFSQPAVSQLEHRKDIKLSTLLNYFDALGLKVEIKVSRRNPVAGTPKELVFLETQ
jgi:hypothetical protein